MVGPVRVHVPPVLPFPGQLKRVLEPPAPDISIPGALHPRRQGVEGRILSHLVLVIEVRCLRGEADGDQVGLHPPCLHEDPVGGIPPPQCHLKGACHLKGQGKCHLRHEVAEGRVPQVIAVIPLMEVILRRQPLTQGPHDTPISSLFV